MPTRKKASRAARSGDPQARVVDAALSLAASRGWRRASLAGVAAESPPPPPPPPAFYRGKPMILAACLRHFDQAALDGPKPGPKDKPRELLFEVLMRRFDALKPPPSA